MEAIWHCWCLLCGIISALAYGGLFLLLAWYYIATLFRRPKHSNFRACQTCEHEPEYGDRFPCKACIDGESMWTPKR